MEEPRLELQFQIGIEIYCRTDSQVDQLFRRVLIINMLSVRCMNRERYLLSDLQSDANKKYELAYAL